VLQAPAALPEFLPLLLGPARLAWDVVEGDLCTQHHKKTHARGVIISRDVWPRFHMLCTSGSGTAAMAACTCLLHGHLCCVEMQPCRLHDDVNTWTCLHENDPDLLALALCNWHTASHSKAGRSTAVTVDLRAVSATLILTNDAVFITHSCAHIRHIQRSRLVCRSIVYTRAKSTS
jgi:hypothetical protein